MSLSSTEATATQELRQDASPHPVSWATAAIFVLTDDDGSIIYGAFPSYEAATHWLLTEWKPKGSGTGRNRELETSQRHSMLTLRYEYQRKGDTDWMRLVELFHLHRAPYFSPLRPIS